MTPNLTPEQLFYIFVGTAVFSLLFILFLLVGLLRKKTTRKERLKKTTLEAPGAGLVRELAAWQGPLNQEIKGKLIEAETEALASVVINLHKYAPPVREELLAFLLAHDAVPRFIQNLQQANYKVRVQAAEVLGLLGSPQAVGPLLVALGDRNDEVRLEVARALGKLKGEEAVQPLIDALKEPEKYVPARVAEVLISMGSTPVPALLKEILSPATDKQTRTFISEILGEIKDPRSVEPLTTLLRDTYPEVRAKAAEALGAMGRREAVAELCGALRDPVWTVRVQAARALGAISSPEAVPVLAQALEDSQWGVRVSAAEALAKIGGEGLEILSRIAQSKDHPVAERASALLKSRG